MKIKDQLCSLELAKQLKKLGVKQDSSFYWCKNTKFKDKSFELEYGTPAGTWQYKPSKKWLDGIMYSAFTDAELEREIFQWIENQEIMYDFSIHFSSTGGVWGDETFQEMYEVQIIDWLSEEGSLTERAGTGANTKAKMLIRLLKNDLNEKKKEEERGHLK